MLTQESASEFMWARDTATHMPTVTPMRIRTATMTPIIILTPTVTRAMDSMADTGADIAADTDTGVGTDIAADTADIAADTAEIGVDTVERADLAAALEVVAALVAAADADSLTQSGKVVD